MDDSKRFPTAIPRDSGTLRRRPARMMVGFDVQRAVNDVRQPFWLGFRNAAAHVDRAKDNPAGAEDGGGGAGAVLEGVVIMLVTDDGHRGAGSQRGAGTVWAHGRFRPVVARLEVERVDLFRRANRVEYDAVFVREIGHGGGATRVLQKRKQTRRRRFDQTRLGR